MWLLLYWQLLFERRKVQFALRWLGVLWALACGRINTALWRCLMICVYLHLPHVDATGS